MASICGNSRSRVLSNACIGLGVLGLIIGSTLRESDVAGSFAVLAIAGLAGRLCLRSRGNRPQQRVAQVAPHDEDVIEQPLPPVHQNYIVDNNTTGAPAGYDDPQAYVINIGGGDIPIDGPPAYDASTEFTVASASKRYIDKSIAME